MGKIKDLSGTQVGRLLVIERAEDFISKNGEKRTMWRCKCECGKYINVRSDCLNGTHTLSCGCYHKERVSESGKKNGSKIKHGESKERLFNIWYLIKYRCEDESSPAYKNYGGRGIAVCKDWSDEETGYFEFKKWALENGYNPQLTIDRIDNDGDYEPSNCRWADNITQGNNKRTNVFIEYDGVRKSISQWADSLGISKKVLYRRIELGWDIERAFTQPVRKQQSH